CRMVLALLIAAGGVSADLALRWHYRTTNDAYEAALAAYQAAPDDETYRILQEARWPAVALYDAMAPREACLALFVVLACLALSGGDRPSLGLLDVPAQGWRYWYVAGVKLGITVVALGLPLLAVWWLSGWSLRGIWDGDSDFGEALLDGAIQAPLYEEM